MIKRRLKTPNDCRRLLASLINLLQEGKITESKAGKLAYMLNIMGKLLEISFQQSKMDALVARLDELEARLGE